MLKFLHDLFWGHHYLKDPEETCFACRCGEHWWPGFGYHVLTKHDTFARWVA